MTKKKTLTFENLIEKAEVYIKSEEIDLIRKAYMYAYEKHFGQKRLTGEDYIIHPLNVSYILTNISADVQTLCAGLLHGVMEDCNVTKEELANTFNDEIANLVDGVTKINKLNLSGDTESVIVNQRKILVGLSEDVRVIILKLADRLHNMQTLFVFPEKKQKLTARETLDILTPIAHRLGMNNIKSELEELSLRYLKPDEYYQIVEKLNATKAQRDNNVSDMIKNVSDILNKHDIKHEIKGRSKSIFSIHKKLAKGKRFSDIYDLLALRVFVETEQDCYQALGIIHSKFRPIPKRFKDYIAMPKTNMYQSLHTTVFGVEGQLFEIQIRTYDMDRIAEYGIASHWSYKEGGSGKAAMQNDMEQKLQFFRSIMELKNNEDNPETFVNTVKEEVLKNTIYVFTPEGDVIELPNGSTPIDFAYKVHTKVGDNTVGAIVNSAIVPLDYKLKNEDIVKIKTNKNSAGPSRQWLAFAKTASAKNKIKNFFNKVEKEENVKQGEENLNKEIKKQKIVLNDFYTDENIEKILQNFKVKTIKEIYSLVGLNKISPETVLDVIYKKEETKEEKLLKKVITHKEIKSDENIIVPGIDKIKVNIASCCKPVEGDRIVGYITKGNGITVHRMVCPNINSENERIIEVSWNPKQTKLPTTIIVYGNPNKNILLEVISKAANAEISVKDVVNTVCKDSLAIELTILVNNKEELFKFIHDIEMIQDVSNVERLIK